jgi:polyphosphate glucokinase
VNAVGVDIGGSGVKGAVVDLVSGRLVTERFRIPTPQSSPEDVLDVVDVIVDHFRWAGPVGVAVPGVVHDGVIRSAANLVGDWTRFDVRAYLTRRGRGPFHILNDADAAGLAEARYGAGHGAPGTSLVLTFGTGIGSALIVDGVLVPNTEFGHLEIHGTELEHYAAGRLVEEDGMDLVEWATRADEVITHLDYIFSPSLIIIGGGISERFDEFKHVFTFETPIVPAVLRNGAGIVGAAMASVTKEL